jgi:hypothetical protein
LKPQILILPKERKKEISEVENNFIFIRTLKTPDPDSTNRKKELSDVQKNCILTKNINQCINFLKKNSHYDAKSSFNLEFTSQNYDAKSSFNLEFTSQNYDAKSSFNLEFTSRHLQFISHIQNDILTEYNNSNRKAASEYAILSLLTFACAGATHLFADANNPEISKVKKSLFGIGCITAISSFAAVSFDRSAAKKTMDHLYYFNNNLLSALIEKHDKKTKGNSAKDFVHNIIIEQIGTKDPK